MAQWVRYICSWIYPTTHTSLSPIWHGFAPCFVNYKKGCTQLAAASDKVYQLLAHGWWFSPGTPASSTTKPDRHDIAEILLKVALKHIKSNFSFKHYILCLVHGVDKLGICFNKVVCLELYRAIAGLWQRLLTTLFKNP